MNTYILKKSNINKRIIFFHFNFIANTISNNVDIIFIMNKI